MAMIKPGRLLHHLIERLALTALRGDFLRSGVWNRDAHARREFTDRFGIGESFRQHHKFKSVSPHAASKTFKNPHVAVHRKRGRPFLMKRAPRLIIPAGFL